METLTQPGYKHTELGWIPEEWEVKNLESVGECIIGLTYSPKNVKEYGTLVLRSSNVQNGKLAFENNVFVEMDLPPRVVVKENDILICVRNGSKHLIGKCALIDKKTEGSAFGAFMSVFRTDLSHFIFHQFQSNIIQKQIEETLGATINQITNKDLKSFLIPVPPKKKEQQAIATTLSDMDAYIRSLEQLIEKKKAIKQAAMQELLTPEEDWEVRKLGEVAEIKDGTHQTPKYKESGVPFFSVENVTSNDFINTKFISEEEHAFLTRTFKMSKGDVLMTRIGSIGDCKYIDWEPNASFYVSLALIRFKSSVDPIFFSYYSETESFKREVDLNSLQHAIPKKINLGPIGLINIFFPRELEEQRRISEIILSLDNQITGLSGKLRKLEKIKQAMMQDLLTGKVRLVE